MTHNHAMIATLGFWIAGTVIMPLFAAFLIVIVGHDETIVKRTSRNAHRGYLETRILGNCREWQETAKRAMRRTGLIRTTD